MEDEYEELDEEISNMETLLTKQTMAIKAIDQSQMKVLKKIKK